MPGIISSSDVVAVCHCMTPAYLRNQIDTSLANFGLACLDMYYLHNPEIQLEQVSRDEFMARMRTAFETLEAAAAQASCVCTGLRLGMAIGCRPRPAAISRWRRWCGWRRKWAAQTITSG